MEITDLTATVHLSGVEDATKKAVALVEKINEAKTLAGELASLVQGLEVKLDV